MFGWLKKSKKIEEPHKRVEVTISKPHEPVELTSEIKKAVEVYLSKGAKASLLYAKAAGYPGDVIDYSNISTFLDALRVNHHTLKDESATIAENWIESELEFCIKNDYWEHFFFSPTERNDGKEGYTEILNLRRHVGKNRISEVWAEPNKTIGGFALAKAIEFKRSDLASIFEKLEERKANLKPLFSRALSSGRNKYGETDYGRLFEEISDFFEYFFPEGTLKFYFSVKPMLEVSRYIERWFKNGLVDTSHIPEDGIEFEHWCAAKLEEQGWTAIVSQASNDQGVDIEARLGDFVVAVQCKRYTQAIGNKAIQEVYTGARNINASAAAVIGTGGFTRSAQSVARSTEVELFDAAEIELFSERFGFEAENVLSNNPLGPVSVTFSSTPERLLALMFRTALNLFDASDLNVSQTLKKSFFDSVNERGVGEFVFDRSELGALLIFSKFALIGTFDLTLENANTIEKHDYPNLPKLKKTRLGQEVSIFELLGEENLDAMREFFLELSLHLPIEIDLSDNILFSEHLWPQVN